MPCCSSEVKEDERSQVVREVADMLESLLRNIRQIHGKESQEAAMSSLFKYLGGVTDLVACGIKLSSLKMKIAQKKDESETNDRDSDSSTTEAAISEMYAE